MSYPTVLAGIHARLATVSGIQAVLDYEPTSVHATPLIYSLLDSFGRSQEGQVTTMRYRTMHRLVIDWQHNEQAEVQLASYVNAIPAAIDADATLGGALASGMAMVPNGQAGFAMIGGTLYRVLDFYSDVVEKAAYRSGI